MALSSDSCSVDYTSDGAQLEYTVPFKFIQDADVVVGVTSVAAPEDDDFTTLNLGTDYTLAGAGDDAGGTLTFASAPVATRTIRVRRQVELTQEASFRTTRSFSPTAVEGAFDKAIMAAQQIQRALTTGLAKAAADLASGLSGVAGAAGAAFGFLTQGAPLTSENAAQVRFRTNGRYAQVSQHARGWQAVRPSDVCIDLRDCRDGAIGAGVVEHDTDALQAAFAKLSAALPATAGTVTGRLYIPAGQYLLGETLEYGGNSGRALFLHGDIASAGPDGSVIKWDGAADGYMLHLFGLNRSTIQDIAFDPISQADRVLWLESFQASGGASSTVNRIRRCVFGAMKNATSIGIAMGADSGPQYQVDQVKIEDCDFIGPGTRRGIAVKQLQGGNVKNLSVLGGEWIWLSKGVVNAGSGFCRVDRTVMAEVDTPWEAGGQCAMVVMNVEVEGCKKFGTYGVTENPGRVVCIANQAYYDTEDPTDDVGLDVPAGAVLIGNLLYNQGQVPAWQASHVYADENRVQNDTGKIYEAVAVTGDFKSAGAGGPTGTGSAIVDNHVTWKYVGTVTSEGTGRRSKANVGTSLNKAAISLANFYRDTLETPWAPLYSAGNNVLGTDGTNAYANVTDLKAISLGDCGGPVDGAPFIRSYFDTIGSLLQVNQAMMALPNPDATCLDAGALHVGINRWEFTFADFSAAALLKNLFVYQVPTACEIRRTCLHVTEAFAGVTTPRMKLGTTSGGAEIIPLTSVAATGLIGATGSQLATGAGEFWEVVDTNLTNMGTRHTAANTAFFVGMTSAAGNLSALTTGKVVVVVEVAAKL